MFTLALISYLFGSRSPSAIGWGVIAVVVYAINGQIGWSFSHIGEEFLERAPSLANFNTASAVIFIAFLIWIVASAKHGSPYSIQRRVRAIMRRKPADRGFDPKTAARLGVSIFQVVSGNDCLRAADATALPKNMTFASVRKSENDQATKMTACDICICGQGDLLSRFAASSNGRSWQGPAVALA